jgi:hypothetical protein
MYPCARLVRGFLIPKNSSEEKPLASDEEVLMSQMPEFGDGEPDPHPVVENVVEEEAD